MWKCHSRLRLSTTVLRSVCGGGDDVAAAGREIILRRSFVGVLWVLAWLGSAQRGRGGAQRDPLNLSKKPRLLGHLQQG